MFDFIASSIECEREKVRKFARNASQSVHSELSNSINLTKVYAHTCNKRERESSRPTVLSLSLSPSLCICLLVNTSLRPKRNMELHSPCARTHAHTLIHGTGWCAFAVRGNTWQRGGKCSRSKTTQPHFFSFSGFRHSLHPQTVLNHRPNKPNPGLNNVSVHYKQRFRLRWIGGLLRL